jgi:phosphonopyruvate decarboxylase
VKSAELLGLLDEHRIDFFAGVPCSLFQGLITTLEASAGVSRPYVAAVREDVAVGVAGGAWFAGRRPAVLMQNSGLGTSLNALASLTLLYGLPALLLVTWRGHGKDAPEHVLTGRITPALLDLLGIPHRVLGPTSAAADLAWARAEMERRPGPVALVVPPGFLEAGHDAGAGAAAGGPAPSPGPRPDEAALVPRLSRLAALEAAVATLGREPVVHANGYICRESFSVADRPQNFYMIGSMGMAAPIGLGLALGRPDRTAVVFDGDGNLLMSLGVLANVAAHRPANFVHCVFDNEVYGSTGNQRSPSGCVRLDRLAAAAGYASVAAATTAGEIGGEMRRMLRTPGPHFLLVKVTAEEREVPRIPHAPEAIRDRFRASVLAP